MDEKSRLVHLSKSCQSGSEKMRSLMQHTNCRRFLKEQLPCLARLMNGVWCCRTCERHLTYDTTTAARVHDEFSKRYLLHHEFSNRTISSRATTRTSLPAIIMRALHVSRPRSTDQHFASRAILAGTAYVRGESGLEGCSPPENDSRATTLLVFGCRVTGDCGVLSFHKDS